MKRSTNRILTTHAGSLPRGEALQKLIRELLAGQTAGEQALADQAKSSVADVVYQQTEAGIDIPSDGEQGKVGFLLYGNQRLNGFEQVEVRPGESVRARRRDQEAFSEFYEEYFKTEGNGGGNRWQPLCTSPISYLGEDAIQFDIDNFKAALDGVTTEEAFLPAIAPGTFGRGQNQYYHDEEAFLFAIADAMREEYHAILDAGFLLQIDDPRLVTFYVSRPDLTIEECRKWAELRVEVLNYALRDIPPERVRFHTCYGINIGPRVHDMELKDIVDILLRINAGAYSFEAANPRHEHEWKVWQTAKLPEGKILIPGIISHTTNLVEHPEAIAERLVRYAGVVGRENVIAGSDCGFSSQATTETEIHPTVVWAKFQAMAEGAALASKELWR